MALFGKKRSSVGLDIGSGFVKLVEVSHAGDRPEVVRVVVRPLLPDAIVEGEIMDPGVVSDTVRDMVEEAGLKKADVVTAVGGHDVIIKKIGMDRMKSADAREVIRWEAEQHVPFDINSVELDFEILDPEGDSAQMEVLLVAAKRELVENRISLLNESGLHPSIIDVDAFALHNAFERNHPEAMEGIVALVNVGHEMTNVNILEDGTPILTRDIPFGTRRIREDLQRQRGLTAEQADELMRRRPAPDDVSAFIQGSADEVAVGVERAAAFLMTRESGAGLGRVYVSGGGACIPGVTEALGGRLAVETQVVNPFERVSVHPEAPVNMVLDESGPMLLLPLGLALRAP
jgi:type IV pilus assembly protein PilM